MQNNNDQNTISNFFSSSQGFQSQQSQELSEEQVHRMQRQQTRDTKIMKAYGVGKSTSIKKTVKRAGTTKKRTQEFSLNESPKSSDNNGQKISEFMNNQEDEEEFQQIGEFQQQQNQFKKLQSNELEIDELDEQFQPEDQSETKQNNNVNHSEMTHNISQQQQQFNQTRQNTNNMVKVTEEAVDLETLEDIQNSQKLKTTMNLKSQQTQHNIEDKEQIGSATSIEKNEEVTEIKSSNMLDSLQVSKANLVDNSRSQKGRGSFNSSSQLFNDELSSNRKFRLGTEDEKENDVLKRQQNLQNLITIKNQNKRKTKFLIASIIVAILFVIGLVVGILMLKDYSSGAHCQGRFRTGAKCVCQEGYYEVSQNDCAGPYKGVTKQEIDISLAGQKTNIQGGFRVFKKNRRERYLFEMKNIQSNKMKGETTVQESLTKYLVDFVTTDVTENYFKFFMSFNNSTFILDSETTEVIGYPEMISKIDSASEGSAGNSDEDVTLTKWEEKLVKDLKISKEQFSNSIIPIIEVEMLKNGTISMLNFPINLRSDIKNIVPQILGQYSPILDADAYHSVRDAKTGQRRVLAEEDLKKTSQKTMFGDVKTDLNAEVDPENNKARLQKGYNSASEPSENGSSISQQSNLSQESTIKDGQLESSSAFGEMNLNKGDTTMKDGLASEEAEQVQESFSMFEDISIKQSAKLNKVSEENVSEKSVADMKKHIQFNYIQSKSLNDYTKFLIEEQEYNNSHPNFEQDTSEDQFVQRLRQLEGEGGANILDGEAKLLLEPYTFKLFQFDVLSMPAKGYVKFICVEGKRGEKDACGVVPQVSFGPNVLTLPSISVKAHIKKYVYQFNWYRIHIFKKLLKIKKDIEFHLNNINNNAYELIADIKKFVNPATNPLTAPIHQNQEIYDRQLTLIFETLDTTVALLTSKYQTILSNPVEELKKILFKVLFKFIREELGTWEDVDLSFLDSIDQAKGAIEQVKNTSSQVCYVLEEKYKQFEDMVNVQVQRAEKFAIDFFDKKIAPPLLEFIAKLRYDLTYQKKEKPNIFDKLFERISNVIVSALSEQKILGAIEKGKEYALKYEGQLKEKLLSLSTKNLAKLKDVRDMCLQKVQQGVNGIDALENYVADVLNIQYYKDKIDELQITDGNNNPILNSNNKFLQYFLVVFEDQNKEFVKIKDAFLEFNTNFQTMFPNGVTKIGEDMKEMVKELVDDFKSTIESVKGSVNFVLDLVKKDIPEIIDTIKEGNKMDWESHEQAASDFINIAEFIEDIKSLKFQIPDIKRTIRLAQTLPQDFIAMKDFLKQTIYDPFLKFKKQKFGLGRLFGSPSGRRQLGIAGDVAAKLKGSLPDFNLSDMDNIYKNVLNKGQEYLDGEFKDKVVEKVEGNAIGSFLLDLQSNGGNLESKMDARVFEQMGGLDDIFKTQLLAIFDKFQFPEKVLFEKELFNKQIKHSFEYQTPIYIKLELTLGVGASANFTVKFGVKDRQVKFTPRLDAQVSAEGSAGVDLYITKIRVVAKGLFFHGYLALVILAGFTTKFFGELLVSAGISPISIDLGVWVSHPTVKLKEKCAFGICLNLPSVGWTETRIFPFPGQDPVKIELWKGVDVTKSIIRKEF